MPQNLAYLLRATRPLLALSLAVRSVSPLAPHALASRPARPACFPLVRARVHPHSRACYARGCIAHLVIPRAWHSNVWCGGSRLWGYSTPRSDYDLYVVHRFEAQPRRVQPLAAPAGTRRDADSCRGVGRASQAAQPAVARALRLGIRRGCSRLNPAALGFEAVAGAGQHDACSPDASGHACVLYLPDVAGGRKRFHCCEPTPLPASWLRRVDDFTAEGDRLELAGYAEAEWLAWRDKFEPGLEQLHTLSCAQRRGRDSVENRPQEEPDARGVVSVLNTEVAAVPPFLSLRGVHGVCRYLSLVRLFPTAGVRETLTGRMTTGRDGRAQTRRRPTGTLLQNATRMSITRRALLFCTLRSALILCEN